MDFMLKIAQPRSQHMARDIKKFPSLSYALLMKLVHRYFNIYQKRNTKKTKCQRPLNLFRVSSTKNSSCVIIILVNENTGKNLSILN